MNVTPLMVQAGSDIAGFMMDAQIQKSLGGIGGCKQYSLTNFPEEYQPLIQEHLDGEPSVKGIFMAMWMARPK